MTKDEALKMAIEAMESVWDEADFIKLAKAINACKEALEQPAQKPVALTEALKHCDGKDCECYAYYQGECACDADWTPEEVVKLRYQLNNTHPHQWQGLSIKEEDDFIQECYMVKTESEAHQLVLAIEQALKEKNCG